MGKTTLIRRLYSPASISSSYIIDTGTKTRVYGRGYVFDRNDWELTISPSFYASSADGTLDNKLINSELSKVKLMYAIGNTERWYDITENPKFSELDYRLDDSETDSCGAFMFCGKTAVGQQFLLKVTAEWQDKRSGMVYKVETENIEIVTLEEMEDEKRFFVVDGTNNIQYNPFVTQGGVVQRLSVGLHSGVTSKNLREEIESGRLNLSVSELKGISATKIDVTKENISFNPTYRHPYMLGGYVGSASEIRKNSQGYVIAPNGAELIVDFVSLGGYVEFVLNDSSVTVYSDKYHKCSYYLEDFDILKSVVVHGLQSEPYYLDFGSDDFLHVRVNCGTKDEDFSFLVQLKRGSTLLDSLPVSMKRVEPSFDVVMENNAPLETGLRKIPYSVYVGGEKLDTPLKYFDVAFHYKKEKANGRYDEGELSAANNNYLEIDISDADVALELTDTTTYKETIND